jgi:hypothetical protein
MNATHTPGPWRVFTTPAGKIIGIGELTGDGVTDARFCLWRGDSAEAEANARLIAAAPELLAALKGILEDDAHTTSLADQRARWTSRMAAAADAIAKAEGRV